MFCREIEECWKTNNIQIKLQLQGAFKSSKSFALLPCDNNVTTWRWQSVLKHSCRLCFNKIQSMVHGKGNMQCWYNGLEVIHARYNFPFRGECYFFQTRKKIPTVDQISWKVNINVYLHEHIFKVILYHIILSWSSVDLWKDMVMNKLFA